MADGDSLLLGNDNNAQSQTSLNRTGFGDDTPGLYGLHVQAKPPRSMKPVARLKRLLAMMRLSTVSAMRHLIDERAFSRRRNAPCELG